MTRTVSVIIPVYNGSHLVRDAVESVLKQTFPAHEILVIDDASRDRDELDRVLEPYVNDGRVTLIHAPENRGPAAARNLGIRHATGDLFAFLDADDRYEPERLEASVEVFERYDDTAMICSDAYIVKDGVLQEGLKNDRWRPIGEIVTFERLLRQNCAYTLSVTISREAFETFGPFDEDPALLAVEDYDLWLRVAAERPVRYVDRPLGRYTVHETSLSANPRRIFDGVRTILTKLERDVPGFRERHGRQVDRRLFKLHVELADLLAATGKRREARREAWAILRRHPFSPLALKTFAKTVSFLR